MLAGATTRVPQVYEVVDQGVCVVAVRLRRLEVRPERTLMGSADEGDLRRRTRDEISCRAHSIPHTPRDESARTSRLPVEARGPISSAVRGHRICVERGRARSKAWLDSG